MALTSFAACRVGSTTSLAACSRISLTVPAMHTELPSLHSDCLDGLILPDLDFDLGELSAGAPAVQELVLAGQETQGSPDSSHRSAQSAAARDGARDGARDDADVGTRPATAAAGSQSGQAAAEQDAVFREVLQVRWLQRASWPADQVLRLTVALTGRSSSGGSRRQPRSTCLLLTCSQCVSRSCAAARLHNFRLMLSL